MQAEVARRERVACSVCAGVTGASRKSKLSHESGTQRKRLKVNRSGESGRRHFAISLGTSGAQCADWNGFTAWRVFAFLFCGGTTETASEGAGAQRRHACRSRHTSRSAMSDGWHCVSFSDAVPTQSGYSRDAFLSRLRLNIEKGMGNRGLTQKTER